MAPSADGDAFLQRLHQQLNPAALAALATIEQACIEDGTPLYLVCGTLRDLALEREPSDIDLAVEGDAIALAERVSSRLVSTRLVVHRRFGTAKLSSRDFQFDLAGTRRERYPQPGSLPQVEPATLAEDLARRDFAINAFALRLAPDAGEIVDPFRGIDDLRGGLIRVLHERSFQDDATRMLRGVRYATRFGFKLQRDTEALLRHDLEYLKRISGPRLRRELAFFFTEPQPVKATLAAQRLGILEDCAMTSRRAGPTRWQPITKPPWTRPDSASSRTRATRARRRLSRSGCTSRAASSTRYTTSCVCAASRLSWLRPKARRPRPSNCSSTAPWPQSGLYRCSTTGLPGWPAATIYRAGGTRSPCSAATTCWRWASNPALRLARC
jgi:hypothetical protein